jgi:CspA family cold shock protein
MDLYHSIDFWPDDRAVSLLALPDGFAVGTARRARSDILTKHRSGELRSRVCAFTHMALPRKVTLMMTGTVKFYDGHKGFGFIQPEDGGKDVYVHATALERAGLRGLTEGQKVSFDTTEDRRSGKIAVDNIQAAQS